MQIVQVHSYHDALLDRDVSDHAGIGCHPDSIGRNRQRSSFGPCCQIERIDLLEDGIPHT